jgi:hypothetical protein
MQPSADDVMELVTQCDESSEEDRDDLLRSFLVPGLSNTPHAGQLGRDGLRD